MAPPFSVSIIYNKSNTFGLADDVKVIENILRKFQHDKDYRFDKTRLLDMREPCVHCDIQFHLEVPIFVAIPWAHTNVLLVNPENWSEAYDSYVHAFDALLFRDPFSAEKFSDALFKKGIRNDHIRVVPWCAAWQGTEFKYQPDASIDNGFACFIGGSTSKYNYVKKVLPVWSVADPPLTVYTTRSDLAEDLKKMVLSENVTIKHQNLTEQECKRLMMRYRGHLICSESEAFGYSAANAEVCGAFTIMNRLPVFEHIYHNEDNNEDGIYWISSKSEVKLNARYSKALPSDNIRSELDVAFNAFRNADLRKIFNNRQNKSVVRFKYLYDACSPMFEELIKTVNERRPSKGTFHCPPILQIEDCPSISIITPTYNRRKMIDIAFHNLLSTDYPHDKIEWVVVEDNENTTDMASDKIINFQIQAPKIKLKYIPIQGRMTIGEKRNIGVENASNDIILFMDDDDHYPSTSFRRRVAWLTKGTKCGVMGDTNIVCCTTIALYDLVKGVSAVNVPPYDIPFTQRVSEATLTFRKSVWEERKFPNVSIAEGEEWLNGREEHILEIPPQQIIVAFSHSSNQSSRRIPPTDQPPACFWGFPKEYLMFIHGLAGVKVEEDKKHRK